MCMTQEQQNHDRRVVDKDSETVFQRLHDMFQGFNFWKVPDALISDCSFKWLRGRRVALIQTVGTGCGHSSRDNCRRCRMHTLEYRIATL